ncbi:MAG: NAD+ diphosphatase [Verrucomicrobiales bacterium]|jgi:NAD+ diphosphatase
MLFIRRERDPGKGKLGLPGGFVDVGESGEEAARREVEEELGLQIGELTYVMSHPNTYAFGGVVYQLVDFFYTATVADFEGVQSCASEVGEWFIARPDTMRGEDFAFVSNWRAVEAYAKRTSPV